ncbi:hypothetical protein NT6N_07960 [Oceaniferula spumae]|uniref:Uncharacterized protein n=1 Tax=Oceaniferula spumae TaxID=2979115 RepID=A0AAT9FII6_9BACT
MISLPRIFALSLIAGVHTGFAAPTEDASSAGPDLLRFANDDTLHGNFFSFGPSETMIWKTPEAAEPIRFSTSKLHRIVLNRGRAHKTVTHKSSVKLANGDVIPGTIISVDEKTVVLDTDHIGRVELPRQAVARISPSPFGGKLLYYGPLNNDGWKTVPTYQLDPNQKSDKKDDDENAPTDWKQVGTAWYAGTDKNRYLLKDDAMPDKCRVAFKLAWRGSLYAKIALHADFSPPKYENKSNSQLDMGATVGNAYILSLSSHNATLYACTFDEDGKPQNTRLQGSQSSLGLSGEESVDIELRMDRTKKNILLFANGSFKAKWNLGNEYAGKGNKLAFLNLRYSNSEIRVSDIVISRWNGLKDSATSMQTPDRDVILLNNGVDRFSGKFKSIRDGKVLFHGSFDNELSIPLDEVGEIHLATDKVKSKGETSPKAVYFFIHPYGRITGIPTQGEGGKTKLLTNSIGDVTLDTRFINIIDFSHKNSLLDVWDDNF